MSNECLIIKMGHSNDRMVYRWLLSGVGMVVINVLKTNERLQRGVRENVEYRWYAGPNMGSTFFPEMLIE